MTAPRTPYDRTSETGAYAAMEQFRRADKQNDHLHPWVGFLEGHKSGRTSAKESLAIAVRALEFYANYMSGDNPEFTKQGWQKYPSPKIAQEALSTIRERGDYPLREGGENG